MIKLLILCIGLFTSNEVIEMPPGNEFGIKPITIIAPKRKKSNSFNKWVVRDKLTLSPRRKYRKLKSNIKSFKQKVK
jgi:hypothetical protein|tara:strand:+ start:1160 stop:1390 length:231 start_codon:yes stop_codon:yes gene_type:complete